jgi:hypothetical protein
MKTRTGRCISELPLREQGVRDIIPATWGIYLQIEIYLELEPWHLLLCAES